MYPEYKAHRVKKRTESEVNWDEIYVIINELSNALTEHFGIKAIKVDRAEGDDVIAVLVNNKSEKSLIVSSDKDFKQLCIHKHVDLYDPIKRKMVEFSSPEEIKAELLKHIIKGDDSDNIPSVIAKEKFTPEFIAYLHQNDVFVNSPEEFFKLEISKHLINKYDVFEKYLSGKLKGQNKDTKAIFKKTMMTENKIKEISAALKDSNNAWLREQFKFNQKLIDLTKIPSDIEAEILEAYKSLESIEPNPLEMVNFCAKHRLMNLVKDIQYFHIKERKTESSGVEKNEW